MSVVVRLRESSDLVSEKSGFSYAEFTSGGSPVKLYPDVDITLTTQQWVDIPTAIRSEVELISGQMVAGVSADAVADLAALTAAGGITPSTAQDAALTAAAVATTAATNTTPYGFSQAQANAIVAAINALVVDVTALRSAYDTLQTEFVAVAEDHQDAVDDLVAARTKINALLASLRAATFIAT